MTSTQSERCTPKITGFAARVAAVRAQHERAPKYIVVSNGQEFPTNTVTATMTELIREGADPKNITWRKA